MAAATGAFAPALLKVTEKSHLVPAAPRKISGLRGEAEIFRRGYLAEVDAHEGSKGGRHAFLAGAAALG